MVTKSCCVGQKKYLDGSLSGRVALFFANLLLDNDKNILCIDKSGNDLNWKYQFGEKRNLLTFSENSVEKIDRLDNGRISISVDETASIESKTFFPIKNIYEKFSNILIATDKNLGIDTKYDLIEKCDFFVLIGRAGMFKRDQLEQFITDTELKKEKCIGFVLVD